MRNAQVVDRPSTRVSRFFCSLFIAGLAVSAQGQTLVIYDDADSNGFNSGYSYGAPLPDMNSTAVVHGGAKAVAFTGSNYNALAWGRASSVSTASYPVLRFWIHGGAGGGQQLRIYASASGAGADAELEPFIAGGSVAAGEWRQVTVDLTAPPFSLAAFDRIDIQSDQAAAQPVVYIDDVVVTQAPPALAVPMTIDRDVTVAGMLSDRFTWRDSQNQPRVAVLAHNDAGAGPGNARGGALREFRYQLPNGATRIASVTTYGNGGYAGFGYVVAHASRSACVGDDSPLGGFIPGTWERIFEGTHHAIFRFRQNYRRNCSTTAAQARTLPVVIDWMFSTGRDHPLWAITYHVDQAAPSAPVDTFYDDSRAPYGELNIDGEGWTGLDGIAWGDKYRFTSTGATPATLNSAWTWNTANTIPFVKEWIAGNLSGTNTKDATMGIVQTQTIAQQDAGGARDPAIGSDITPLWTKTSATVGNACTNPTRTHPFPCANDWPYQAYANSLDYEFPNASNNARLTWKTQYGFLGQASYALNDGSGGTAAGYPKKSYSTWIVLGTHSSGPVEAQIAEAEAIQTVTLTTVGSVVTQGPAGIDRADTVAYSPAGYNHVYGAFALHAAGNQLDANIAVGAGTLTRPLFIIGNYTAAEPLDVRLDGVSLVADADYFASVRAGANELWLTLNRTLAGTVNRLEITNDAAADAPSNLVATANSTTSVQLTWTGVAGADSYEIHRRVSSGAFAFLASVAATNHADAGLTADTAYLYRVRAVTGAVTSAFSNVDAATTTLFTDDPLVPGNAAKSVHITQLRTAVNALRAAAALGPFAFSDSAAAGTPIRAVHLTQLRTALDQARANLELPAVVYTDPAIAAGSSVKAVHVAQLRAGVK